ncbi:site-specific DNA-methyltransferase, partial [Caviibacterium pharyngocola]
QLSSAQLYTKQITKRQEIFFNQVLAFDEIDRLFDPKALTHFSRYTKDGKSAVTQIKRRTDGTPTENLIIKGNNLIALHSLATQFRGKVKLIYIDPPYYFRKTKAEDSFAYNSNFKLSTWLTFMKNRLEIAKELLTDDGVIFVSIDDDGLAHLKLLMDDIFTKENFIAYFMWMKTATPPSLSKNVRKKLEYVLCYRKNTFEGLFGGIVEGGDMPLLNESNALNTLEFPAFSVQFKIPDGIYYPAKKDKTTLESELVVCNGWNSTPFKLSGNFKWTQSTITKEIENNTTFIIKSEKFAIRYIREGERNKKPSNFISKIECGVGTNEDAKKELFELFQKDLFKYPKPESLISYLINTATNESDIVLDYHLGSGTTAAVAHKMGRQYIGIEQMDYVETLAVERLKKVIDGEQGGISKEINWQGGGEFVYCELGEWNAQAKAAILACDNWVELDRLFTELCDKYFLKYNVNVQKFANEICQEPEFLALTLDEQKQMMLEMLDLNQLYINVSDMNDSQFECGLNQEDKDLTLEFYGMK